MPTPIITEAKKRLLSILKTEGAMKAVKLAEKLDLTDIAIRQHLAALEVAGYVEQRLTPPKGRGRPSSKWNLTDKAAALFPDHHAELTVDLITAIRISVGEEGLQKIVDVRARDQLKQYRKLMPKKPASLKKRVEALAKQRTHEGYMAEVVQEKQGVYLLIEHNCPICNAAKTCQGLCNAELDVFQKTIGRDAKVQRTSHLLTDSDRCVYRIQHR